MTALETQDIVVTRLFDAPVEKVWNAWRDPEQVMRWWGPTGFTSPLAKIDFREGGTSLVCMHAPQDFGGQDFYNTWAYTKIVPMERIEFIQSFADEHGHKVDPTTLGLPEDAQQDVRSVVAFKALDNGQTEMTAIEYGWQVGQMMEMSRMGLEQCLDKMAESLK